MMSFLSSLCNLESSLAFRQIQVIALLLLPHINTFISFTSVKPGPNSDNKIAVVEWREFDINFWFGLNDKIASCNAYSTAILLPELGPSLKSINHLNIISFGVPKVPEGRGPYFTGSTGVQAFATPRGHPLD